MKRELEPYQMIERSIIKKYRKELWTPFIVAVKRYELIQAGDKIAVCISGGKDSMLMAKLMQELQKHSDVPFELVFLVMDPGYNELNRQKIESNAALLHIPVTIFESNIFSVANNTDKNPCYLCARMRRGHLYSKAKEFGCNKIALGHHFNDVIETTVMSMFYGSQLQAMPPKLHSTSFPGMTLIRPMYCIREEDILAWKRYNDLEFILPLHRELHHVRQWRRRFQAAGDQAPAPPPQARQPQHRKQHFPQHPCRRAGHHAGV
jgi:tRNA 2-thiocytidine biosynthesis protein TtcA